MTNPSSEYFERVAGQWDTIRAGYFTEAVREAAIAKAYLRPEMVVADVGAGTGFIAAGLAPRVSKVHVIDGSDAMLAVARQNLSAFSNIEYHQGESLSLPLPDASLDAVFANMYLHHCPEPLKAIREMIRLLKPGGRLVITDMDVHTHEWMKEEMSDLWLGFERDQLRAWFREAGLVNVVIDRTGQSCCAKSEHPDAAIQQERTSNISVFLATATRRMTMRDTVQQVYGARAEQADSASSCCGSSEQSSGSCCSSSAQSGASCCSTGSKYEEVTFTTGYTAEELSAAPKESADISLGCGNPTAMAGIQPGETVLDIGSGGGLDAFLAAQKVGPQGRVIGVDMTPAMLERARASAERGGFSNVEFRQGYAEALPVEDATVDLILSNCVINLTEDKGQVFQEALRVLKPGGRLEVSDMVTSGPVPLALRQMAAGWAECVTGALPEQEYLDLIAQAGFEGVSTRRSASMGEAFGISVYSVTVSARKPGGQPTETASTTRPSAASSCGCSSGCCG